MQLGELILLALGLAMDAFAVSICKGLAVGRVRAKHLLVCGLWFGGFQALMPLVGYLLGAAFETYISSFDHWIAFLLLTVIGVNMIREALSKEEECPDASIAVMAMLPMAVATSIDALAVGITFGVLHVDVLLAVLLIGVITAVLSAIGVKLGSIVGGRYRMPAELCGGILLILLGTKILLEHLGILVL